MPLYKLPLGIRIPNTNEYPNGYDANSINAERDSANIIEGYTLKKVSKEKFSYFAEVNVDADKIWDVFCDLADKLIGGIAYGILCLRDEKPLLSKYAEKASIISIFEKYKFELTNDGFLEFGIAFNDGNILNEIFISSFKYFKIWTVSKEPLIDSLDVFSIKEVENLQFIDEFSVVSEALKTTTSNDIKHYSEVMECIEREFENL